MKKPFTIGMITGISALALSIPVLAQISSAQGATTSATSSATSMMKSFKHGKPDTTQAGVQAMIARDDAFLANIDAFVTAQKSAMQAHRTALAAAVLLADNAARQTAVQKAHDVMRTAMQTAMTSNPALKTMMPFGRGGHGPKDFGKGHGRMLDRDGDDRDADDAVTQK